MGVLERSILLLLASSVSALGSLAEPPVVTKVEPGQGFTNVATPITVRGAGFEPQAKVALLPGGVTRAGADADIDVHGVAVAGDHAYAVGSSSSYTFRVVDIGDPSAPLIVGGLVTLPGPTAVAVSGTTAFVTGYYWNYPPGSTWEESATWLALVDVSAPAAPFLIESYFLGSWKYPEAIAVSGDTLFVLSLFDGLRIYDLGDPAGPAPVSWLDTGQNARGMSVSGRHLFVAAGEGGLEIIDVDDPTSPVLVGSYDTQARLRCAANDVAVAGSLAFVTCENLGLLILDVSDPAVPSLRGSYVKLSEYLRVAVFEDTAFLSSDWEGVDVIDVSDPAAPVKTAYCSVPALNLRIAADGRCAVIAGWMAGLLVTEGACADLKLGGLRDFHEAYDLAVSGSHAFVTGWGYGLRIVDISDPTAPQPVLDFTMPERPSGIAISGGLAALTGYAAPGGFLRLVDVSDPAAPSLQGAVGLPDKGVDAVISGAHAFVAARRAGLQIVDISDRAAPTVVGACDTGEAWDIALSGRYALVAAGHAGLKIVDVGDPRAPAPVGTCDTPGFARDVAVFGNYALVADDRAGLRIIDISDPAYPAPVGLSDVAGATHVEVLGPHAFVTTDAGLQVVDISDPAAPWLVTIVAGAHDANAIALAGGLVYTVGDTLGFQIFRPNPPLAARARATR